MSHKHTAPIHSFPSNVREWLKGGQVRAGWLIDHMEFSAVLSGQGFEPGDVELREQAEHGWEYSWLGGPAAAPLDEWPRNIEGTPLAHIATFSLREVDVLDLEAEKDWGKQVDRGLPNSGYLEVFHDRETYGYEIEDRDRRGWLVRWTEKPDLSRLVDPPADLELPREVCQGILCFASFSLPSSLDVSLSSDVRNSFETYEEVIESYRRAWTDQRFQNQDMHPMPVSHFYGHSQAGEEVAVDTLRQVLPLSSPSDRYRLILDLDSWTYLDGWFGDASPLEVWMRESDLKARRFDQAWCMIRTD